MSIIQALGFMVLGGMVVELFEIHAWRRYQMGKTEGKHGLPDDSLYWRNRP